MCSTVYQFLWEVLYMNNCLNALVRISVFTCIILQILHGMVFIGTVSLMNVVCWPTKFSGIVVIVKSNTTKSTLLIWKNVLSVFQLRETQTKMEELETSHNHLQRRLDKLKTAKSALLKEIWIQTFHILLRLALYSLFISVGDEIKTTPLPRATLPNWIGCVRANLVELSHIDAFNLIRQCSLRHFSVC